MKAHSVGREAVLGRRSGACARGRPLPDQVLESGRFWVKADLSSGSAAKDLQRLTPSRHRDSLGAQVKAYRGSSSSMELMNRSSRASFDAGYAIERYEPDTRHRRARS
jgi:hypothetical protein